jgi:hypothetical protein
MSPANFSCQHTFHRFSLLANEQMPISSVPGQFFSSATGASAGASKKREVALWSPTAYASLTELRCACAVTAIGLVSACMVRGLLERVMSNSAAIMQKPGTERPAFQLRIFPHSSQEEFLTEDSLRAWLLNGLRGRGGRYLLRRENAVHELPVGSIVLFRYGDKIIGEGVVSKAKKSISEVTEKTEMGTKQEYTAHVHFNPSSIRLYAPALDVKEIKDHVKSVTGKDIDSAQPYYDLDWSVYPYILSKVVKEGTFIS